MSETISIVVEDAPTQLVNIFQEPTQSVVIEETVEAIVEISAEGLPGAPGSPGVPGPTGPAGPDLNTDLVDLTLLFENQLI